MSKIHRNKTLFSSQLHDIKCDCFANSKCRNRILIWRFRIYTFRKFCKLSKNEIILYAKTTNISNVLSIVEMFEIFDQFICTFCNYLMILIVNECQKTKRFYIWILQTFQQRLYFLNRYVSTLISFDFYLW